MKSNLILLVDDDRNFVTTTKRVLKSSGFRVVTAHNSSQCYAQLKKHEPDLIILDIMLEKTGTGFEICRNVKQNAKTRSIPVIMLSAIDKAYPFKFSSASGDENWLPADEFLNKPIDAEDLILHIKRLLKS